MTSRRVVVYEGETFRISGRGKYYFSDRKDSPERLLHRRIWVAANGPIPADHHIHHRDGDRLNYDIANLECIPGSEHSRGHMLDRMARPEFRQRAIQALRDSAPLAAEWHRSDEGRAWHRDHARKAWVGREPTIHTCERCGGQFESLKSVARFCSRACNQAFKFAEGRYETDRRICAFCGKEFMANRHRAAKCCSRGCASRKRSADSRM